ncbi:MAG: hypothetical protein P8J87_05630 [Verrucomicrobiales bacterium]|nr:hypothetical protein [Verrucomicrobiales bacterium]
MRIYREAEAIYRNPEGDAAEVVAAVRAARMGLRAKGPGLFQVSASDDFLDCWKRWIDCEFRVYHAPQLAVVHAVALEEGAMEVAELDRDYGECLGRVCGPERVEASLRLGEDVLDALQGAKSVRLVSRLAKSVGAGKMAGHFATLIGCHAAVLNVALAHAVISLAFHEWKLGGGGARLPKGRGEEAGFGFDAEDAGLSDVVAEVIRGKSGREGVVACA